MSSATSAMCMNMNPKVVPSEMYGISAIFGIVVFAGKGLFGFGLSLNVNNCPSANIIASPLTKPTITLRGTNRTNLANFNIPANT